MGGWKYDARYMAISCSALTQRVFLSRALIYTSIESIPQEVTTITDNEFMHNNRYSLIFLHLAYHLSVILAEAKPIIHTLRLTMNASQSCNKQTHTFE